MTLQETEHIIAELQTASHYNTQQAYSRVLKTLAERKKKRRLQLWVSISTAAALLVFALSLWMPYEHISNNSNATLALVLPDSSEVTLNAGARLVYAKQMQTTREVKLTGEGFFNVHRDTTHPFIITAGKHQIKVLGTSFNVKSNASKNTFEVLVESGLVEVSYANNTPLQLSRGEKVKNIKGKLIKTPNNLIDINDLSWYHQKMSFDASPLHYVIQTIEKTYHIPIQLADQSLDSLKISTTFDGLSQDEVLTSICLTLNLQLKQEQDYYVIDYK